MRVILLFLLLAACTVPPSVPVKEEPPTRETGIAEAPPVPPAPPKPKPQKPPPASTAKTETPPAPALPPCPAPVNPKQRILQELDCLIIKIEETKPK